MSQLDNEHCWRLVVLNLEGPLALISRPIYLFFFLFAFKCTILNEKLNLLLNTLSIESEALPSSSREELSSEGAGMAGNGNGRQKVFVPKEALMSRANSLKKALKQIIEHAEQGMSKSR